MAIIRDQPGLGASITTVDGTQLTEHLDEVASSQYVNTTINYIKAVEGEFQLLFRVQSPFEIEEAIVFKPVIDGTSVMGRSFLKDKYEANQMILESSLGGVYEGSPDGTILRPFNFFEIPKSKF